MGRHCSRSITRRNRLNHERLEDRQLMAGDVTVAVNHGVLTITGDDESNAVQIAAGATEGEYVITGLADGGGTETTVGGDTSTTVIGVTRGISVKLGEGDDSLTIDNTEIAVPVSVYDEEGANATAVTGATFDGSLRIDGSSTVAISDTTIDGSLAIKATTDADSVTLSTVSVARSASVNLGDGDDTLDITGGDFGSLGVDSQGGINCGGGGHDFGGEFAGFRGFLRGGFGGFFGGHGGSSDEGTDTITISDVTTTGSMSVRSGGGDDTVTLTDNIVTVSLAADGGGGTDTVAVSGGSVGSLRLAGGSGDNTIHATDIAIAGLLSVTGGSGIDTVTLDSLDVDGNTAISLGAGADALSIVDSIFARSVAALLGAGDDTVSITGSQFDAAVRLRGNAGSDTLTLDADSVFAVVIDEDLEV